MAGVAELLGELFRSALENPLSRGGGRAVCPGLGGDCLQHLGEVLDCHGAQDLLAALSLDPSPDFDLVPDSPRP